MLNVSSVLELYSKYDPSTKDVLFKEDFSLMASMLGPKMASRSLFDVMSLGSTSDPKIFLDLRYRYGSKVLNCFNWLSIC